MSWSTGCKDCLRAKARSCWISVAARSAPAWALSRERRSGLSSPIRRVPPGVFWTQDAVTGPPLLRRVRDPFTPGLSRAAGGILPQQPVLVRARDEGPDRGANLLGIAEDPAQHDLLLEGADEPLRHTIGLGLADEGKARRQAEEGDLVLEGVGHKGAAVVVAEQKATGGVGPHRPPGRVDW